MIIDFRVRPPFGGFTAAAIYNPRPGNPEPWVARPLQMNIPYYRSFAERSMEAFITEMDAAGIGLAVVMGRQSPPPYGSVPNEDIVALLEQYPKRFIGFGGINSSDPAAAMAEVEKCIAWGMKGVAFDNGWCSPPLYDDDERLMPIYARCAEAKLIVSFTSSVFVGPDLTYCDPVHIQRVARRFPDLRIVVAHAAWPYTVQICAVAFQCSNVYLIPDFYGHVPNTPGADEYVKAANYYLGHRLLFASSYPVRPLGQSVEQFRAQAFDSDEIRWRCLGGNAARLLGL